MKLTLIIIGVALEVGGLLLTASPELDPRARRAVAAVRRIRARIESRVRLLLLRPRKGVTHKVSMDSAIGLEGRASAVVSVSDDAPPEQKLSFLIQQALEAQERLNKVESRVADLPPEWRRDVEATRSALEERIAQELEQQRELFIGRRLLGLAFIATGSVVLAFVNLL